jgi:hypothetical protein
MPQLNLFIDTTVQGGQLLASQTSSSPINAASLPFQYGDTISLQVYLLTRIANPNGPGTILSGISTVGISLQVYLCDTLSSTVYTQQIVWTTDPNNSYFIGNLALNTTGLLELLGGGASPMLASAQCQLKINYVQNGLPTTVYNQTVTVGVGSPNAAQSVPAGLTPLSVQVAQSLFLPKQPVNGQGIILASNAGKQFILQIVDNPDGTASFIASEIT